MGCAVPILLYSSFWQLGSPNTLHIHVKLYLTMRLQSPDTLLRTQSIVVRHWPSVSCRSVDIFTVSLLSASYCGVSTSQKHLEDRRSQVSLWFSDGSWWKWNSTSPQHNLGDRNCFNKIELSSLFVCNAKPWNIDTAYSHSSASLPE